MVIRHDVYQLGWSTRVWILQSAVQVNDAVVAPAVRIHGKEFAVSLNLGLTYW